MGTWRNEMFACKPNFGGGIKDKKNSEKWEKYKR